MDKQRIFPWGDHRRYYSYSRYFKKLFGERIQKLTLDAGFTCPNRDGSIGRGGCTFCNNEAFNPSYCDPAKNVATQIAEGIAFHAGRYPGTRKFLAYFQAYSNTYKPLEQLKAIYGEAIRQEAVAGIVVGTRPDCIDDEKLDYFARLAEQKYVAIEYGVESCNDGTLKRVNRGHDFDTARRAIEQTAGRGIHTGAHFILGLPGESREGMIRQTDLINALPLDTVKFHQLQLFKGTALAEEYALHPERFEFFTLEEYLDFFIEILTRLRGDLVVERFAGEAPPRFHAGPAWGLIRNEQLLQKLEKRLEERDLWQGCRQSPSISTP